MNHHDILGRPIEVGAKVAYPRGPRQLVIGYVGKLTPKRVGIKSKPEGQYMTYMPPSAVVVIVNV